MVIEAISFDMLKFHFYIKEKAFQSLVLSIHSIYRESDYDKLQELHNNHFVFLCCGRPPEEFFDAKLILN